jgi:hypothetical protein
VIDAIPSRLILHQDVNRRLYWSSNGGSDLDPSGSVGEGEAACDAGDISSSAETTMAGDAGLPGMVKVELVTDEIEALRLMEPK